MAANTNDKITSTRNSARPNSARVNTTRIAAATSLSCDNLAGWPTSSKVHFVTYKIDTSNNVIAGTQLDCSGIVSGNTIGSLVVIDGTDAGNAIGDVVEMLPTAQWGQDLYTALTNQHSQLDGSHTAITATSLTATGVVNASTVSSLQDTSVALSTYRTDYCFDFVQSGLVWSGLGYGSTLTATMTSGVVYINGQRLAISSVATRTFTASKDTYIDILNTAGVGSIVYTEVANNAASPALAANSVRIGIIVSGANIAAATSVNQGQESMLLPIASSIPYAVTDSLGNLICPRDPNRKVLGYRRIVTNFTTTATTDTQVTGLSVPVIVPTGRKIKVSVFSPGLFNATAANKAAISIWDGVVAVGTELAYGYGIQGGSSASSGQASATVTPTTTSKTYNVGLVSSGATVATVEAAAVGPAYIQVELV